MAKIIRRLTIAFALATAMASVAQQPTQGTPQAVMGKAVGASAIDGTQSPPGTLIFVSQNVASDTSHALNVVNEGNMLVFTPDSHFEAMKNGYKLNSGGSHVVTYTGMTAHLPDCFSVTPVTPIFMTLYEVYWHGNSAWVYARREDVKINYWATGEPNGNKPNPQSPTRDWIVKEGHSARIRDVKLCKPLVDFWPQPNLPTTMEMLGTTAVVTSEPWWWPNNMSSESPAN